MVIAPCLFVARIREALNHSERQLLLQSWHLRRLVPDEGDARRRD
jgi:hypothetical protein